MVKSPGVLYTDMVDGQATGERDGIEEALARDLADSMGVLELRRWCRRHNVVRERGDSKIDTARRAVEQNPVAVAKYVAGEARS